MKKPLTLYTEKAYGISRECEIVVRLVYDQVCGKTGVRDVGIPILTVLGLGQEEGTADKRRGIRCNFTTVLEDPDFAHDIALLSSTFNDLHEKTGRLAEDVARVGLKLNARRCSGLGSSGRA